MLKSENLISVVGLGYVGLPLAVTFAEKGQQVIAFDNNNEKVEAYKNNIDLTSEIGAERLSQLKNIVFTTDENLLAQSKFHIVAVPTPVYQDKVPNLEILKNATRVVGRNLSKDSIVVYESTVYPGVTEDICVPILEKESGLICGKDFKVGYSPERINPGDKVHRLENIVKIVSGMDKESLNIIASKYEMIVNAGVYRASSIKVAEAAKVIENSQRDINIAFMNELSIIFELMGIDTREVLEAAGTKWNFLKFAPGLVGGHCIGVDPYYLTYKAEELGYISSVILSGRVINNNMGKYVAEKTIKEMILNDQKIKDSNVLILGIAFKENVKDIRNSKVLDIYYELKKYGVVPIVVDPVVRKSEVKEEYGIDLVDLQDVKDIDSIIICVAHNEFLQINIDQYKNLYKQSLNTKIMIDVKGILDKDSALKEFKYWRL